MNERWATLDDHKTSGPGAGPDPFEDGERAIAAKVENGSKVRQGSAPKATGTRRRRIIRLVAFIAVPILLAIGIYYSVIGSAYVVTDDAYVSSDIVAVSTDVSGIVKEVDVADNERVEAGQVLFKFDDQPFRLKLTEAQAQLGSVRDDINALKAKYHEIEAQIGQTQAKLAYDQLELQRQQTLSRQRVVSQETLDRANLDVATDHEALRGLQAQLAATAASLAGDPNIPVEQHPDYLKALAQRDEAARELKDSVVRAPFAGFVTNVPSLQPGMYLTASTPAVNVVATQHVWVEAQPKETDLTYVRPAQPVTITVDTYPEWTWYGVVQSVSPASASEFSLLPAENTSGNWVKVVQRIPVRIRIDTKNKAMPVLRAGMSVEVSIAVGEHGGLPGVLASIFGLGGRP